MEGGLVREGGAGLQNGRNGCLMERGACYKDYVNQSRRKILEAMSTRIHLRM